MRKWIVAAVFLASGMAVWAFAQEGKEKSPDAGAFAGKVFVYYTHNELSHAMRDVQFKEIGGRRFLTGSAAPVVGLGEWFKGTPIAVPWDAVTTYMLMTDEQYQKFLDGEAAGDARAAASPIHAPTSRSPIR